MRKHRWATTIGVALVTCAGSMASRLLAPAGVPAARSVRGGVEAGIALDVTRAFSAE